MSVFGVIPTEDYTILKVTQDTSTKEAIEQVYYCVSINLQ